MLVTVKVDFGRSYCPMYFVESILGPGRESVSKVVIQRQYATKTKNIHPIIKSFKPPYNLYRIHARLHSFIRMNRTQILLNDNRNVFTKNILYSPLTARHAQLNSYDMKKYRNTGNYGCVLKFEKYEIF